MRCEFNSYFVQLHACNNDVVFVLTLHVFRVSLKNGLQYCMNPKAENVEKVIRSIIAM